MNKAQKIIKYLAVALAIYLICEIFIILANIIGIVGSSLNTSSKNINVPSSSAYLIIDLNNSSLTIKEGDKFTYQTDNKNIEVTEEKNKLIIKEKNDLKLKSSEVIVTIPKDMTLNDTIINVDIGKVSIENLVTESLGLNVGAGNVLINNITVTKNCEIDGGAGNITIKNAKLYNADIDLGIGKTIITGTLNGKNEIDTGIGGLEFNLIGTLNDYELEISKGVGSITLNDKELKDDEKIGTGSSQVKIDGGIGAIDIKMKEELK